MKPEVSVRIRMKYVPRLARTSSLRVICKQHIARGMHLISGGTSGLGLLSGRWLAQRGVHRLVLASRGGLLVYDTAG